MGLSLREDLYMKVNELKNILLNKFANIDVRAHEPMKNHTSFKIGGAADLFVIPKTVDQIQAVIELSQRNDIPYFIIGNGSNLLVNDEGYRGVIIQISKNMNDVKITEGRVNAEAGILLSSLSKRIAKEELKGFEFASGIPGTLGGAIYMNAGAYGGEIKDRLVEVRAMDEKGGIHTYTKEELELGYRKSIFQKNHYFILEATLEFEKGNKDEIDSITKELTKRRKEKQPLDMPSAGSVFKRPEGYYAGKLIMDAGLRGCSIGGAQVSEKHCGFIVNIGNATAQDVIDLIAHIRKTVYKQFGVIMQPEVRILGLKGLEDIQLEELG